MPTQTVYLPEEVYQHVVSTKADDQSTSARVTELVQQGIQMEGRDD